MSREATLQVALGTRLANPVDGGETLRIETLAAAIAFAAGLGAGTIDVLWRDTRTLGASGEESLDLAAGLVDQLGSEAAFRRVKALLVMADSGNAGDMRVRRADVNGAPLFAVDGHGLRVRPGGLFLLSVGQSDGDGYVITPGGARLLTVTNMSGASAGSYTIAVLGNTA